MTKSLVLVPGLQSDASSWMPLLGPLGRRHPFLIPMGHQYKSNISEMAENVVAQSPDEFHLVGWSMGGYIALEIMRLFPERLKSLTLIGTTARAESEASRKGRFEAIELAREKGLVAYQSRNLKRCFHDATAIAPAHIQMLLATSEHLGLESLVSQSTAIMARSDYRPCLKSCPCPVHIIVGRQDRIIPLENSIEMKSLLPGATLSEIDNCGHCPPAEHPELVSGLLSDWVDSLS